MTSALASLQSSIPASSVGALQQGVTLNTTPTSGLKRMVWFALAGSVPLAFIVALSVGRIAIQPMSTLAWLAGASATTGTEMATAFTVLGSLRLPRALLALVLGGGLGVAGAVLQCVLRNPLGGPQNTGLLAGAGAGGTLALLLSATPMGVVTAAFAGGMLALASVLWLARVQGHASVLSLVLSGVVVSSLFTAVIALLQYLADPERQLPNLVFWLMGSLAAASPSKVWLAVLCVVPAVLLLWALVGRLDALASGDTEAQSLGLHPARLRLIALVATALICSAVVACGGLVAWVGLVVPHIARLLVGSSMRMLLPASALIGATVLLMVDTLCRSVSAAEIPLGAVTAIVGAPFFAWLVKRQLAVGNL
jgi:iron complex transport system permease protein